MMPVRVDARGVVEALERARKPGPSGVAFDADGTLWSGDVGEDVFEFATSNELLRHDAVDELGRVAAAHGLATRGTPSEIAAGIFAGYRRGEVDERLTCEVMTWAYAGLTFDELREISEKAFEVRALEDRVRRILEPVFDWTRREKVRVLVISASPQTVVDAALARAGIQVETVAAGRPTSSGGRIAPGMAAPLPYGPAKRVFGEEMLSGSDWLASFGDNAFDFDMLRAARVGVAVCPKPALAARLAELTNTVVLE